MMHKLRVLYLRHKMQHFVSSMLAMQQSARQAAHAVQYFSNAARQVEIELITLGALHHHKEKQQ